ncbi:hypothetical protein BaRGS_00030328 [Batillaria attramentaria]|uniref:VWFA domain-containing protein n=1 Tax=Batillaria attramentaria TaxID=370345 RepID=A0ABD0JU63_9CAEN
MSSKMKVTIQKADTVHTADTMTFNYDGQRNKDPSPGPRRSMSTTSSQPVTDERVQEGLSEIGATVGSGDLRSIPSLPTTDGDTRTATMQDQNGQAFRFPTPVQDSGDATQEQSSWLSAPVPVESAHSTDYISVGRSDLQPDAVPPDPATEMEDLKLPAAAAGDPDDQPNASSQGPYQDQEQTSQKASAVSQAQASPSTAAPAAEKQSYSSAATQSRIADSGIGDSLPSLSSGSVRRSLSVTEGEHGAVSTKHSLSSLSSAGMTGVQCDGGGEGEGRSAADAGGQSGHLALQNVAQDIFVFLKGNMLLQDEKDPGVLLADLRVEEDVLKESQRNSFFPEGASQLLTVTWFGFRQFFKTKWSLRLNADMEPSQKEELVRQFSVIMLEQKSEHVTLVVKQLQLEHKVYLQRIAWEKGVVVYLGHANQEHGSECTRTPHKERIQAILQQLLPDQAEGKFSLEDVTLSDDDEGTENRPSLVQLSGGTFRSTSVNTTDLYDSFHGSSSASTAGNSTTFRESGSISNLSDRESRCPASPSVDVIETSSQSSIQVLSPDTSNGNGTLLSLLNTQNEERFQALSERLTTHQESHCQDMDDVRKTLREMQVKLDRTGSDNRASLKQMESTLQQQQQNWLEDLKKNLASQFEQMSAEFQKQQTVMMSTVQQDVQKQQLMIEDVQKDRDTRLRLAQEDMRNMYASYETRGRRFLDGALRQVQDTGLQCRELAVQRDKRVELMLQKFKAELLTLTLGKQQQYEKFMHDLQEHVVQQQVKDESKYQASLIELNKLRQELQQLKVQGVPQSLTVGTVREGLSTPPDELGAVGGQSAHRSFTKALSDAEAFTTKGTKQEELLTNQSESLRLPESMFPEPTSAADSYGSFTLPKTYADAAASGDGPKQEQDSPASQNGARRKLGKTDSGERKKNGRRSPPGSDSSSSSGDNNSREKTSQSSPKKGTTSEDAAGDMTRAEQFLDWISIRGSLRGQSDLAQRLTESCLDTILCLDVSESIVQEGYLDDVKETALSFVDGIEDLMDEMDLEENIAVVTMGGRARVVQHLTNDLTLVRDAIESIDDSGGRSPFMEALLVCLAANKGRGGIVNISGVYKVRPRIIFITDGRPTDETVETGSDVQSNMNQKFMESLANLSGGELVQKSDITRLCRYYKVQQTIGRVYKMVKNHKDDYSTDERMLELVAAISVNMATGEKELIVEEVKRLQKEPAEEEEPEADDFGNVFEDEEKVKNNVLPPLGTRVRRGPHWKWKNQDTDGPGTVIHHSKNDNWIYVKWDNGTYNAYRFNEDDRFDLEVTDHDPRLLPTDRDSLDFGVRVVKGPDWKFNDQDGGGPGTVIRVKESDGKVKVRWDANGKIHEYNYSEAKGREVQFYMPEFPRMGQPAHGDVEQDKDESQDPESEKTIPMWKWKDSKGHWRLYTEEEAKKLETEYQRRKQGSCVIFRAGLNRRVSFKTWQEKGVDGGPACDVERENVPVTETQKEMEAVSQEEVVFHYPVSVLWNSSGCCLSQQGLYLKKPCIRS